MLNGLRYYLLRHKLNPLISRVFHHYQANKDNPLIVSGSIPVLFFGDLEAYSKSKTKIITVALNPSDKEFDEPRFYTSADVYNNHGKYIAALSAYFKRNPYRRWFNNYEKLLQRLNASYYPEEGRPDFISTQIEQPKVQNRVLHTDICSPLATSQTWSKIKSKEDRAFRTKLEKEGIQIWFQLAGILKPDIILISGAKSFCDYFNISWEEVNLPDDFDRTHKMRRGRFNGSAIYWLSGKNTPLSFKDNQLETVARLID
jgi:hypothetical protein